MTVRNARRTNGSMRMSPRTRSRELVSWRVGDLASLASPRRARSSIGAERSMPTSVNAGRDERQRNAPGAAAKLEHRAVGVERDAAPERHVAPAERPRVLPVVERRVVVPAFPAFAARALPRTRVHHDDCARPRALSTSPRGSLRALVPSRQSSPTPRFRQARSAACAAVCPGARGCRRRRESRRKSTSLIASPDARAAAATFHISHKAGCAQQTAQTDP